MVWDLLLWLWKGYLAEFYEVYFGTLVVLGVVSLIGDIRYKKWKGWRYISALADSVMWFVVAVFLINVFVLMSRLGGSGIEVELFGFVLLFVSFLFPAYFGIVKEYLKGMGEFMKRVEEGIRRGVKVKKDRRLGELVYDLMIAGLFSAQFAWLFLVLSVGVCLGLYGFAINVGVFQVLGLMLVVWSGVIMLVQTAVGLAMTSKRILRVFRHFVWEEEIFEEEDEEAFGWLGDEY